MSDNKKFAVSQKNKVKRLPDRGHYDKETLNQILDAGRVCHVGFCIDGSPFVIPTLYGREGDVIYFHGATTSRMLKHLQKGVEVCMTVTHVDALVLARSIFHHSMNYRSAVVFGKAKLLDEGAKLHALEVVSENMLPGRWEEARKPNARELKATSVLAMDISTASCKIRTGPPGDEKEDYELDIWAGVLPFEVKFGQPNPDPSLKKDIGLPRSVMLTEM